MESQCVSRQKVLELQRTAQTCWFYACHYIFKLKVRLDCIVSVLAVVPDNSDGEAACEAKRLLKKINLTSFVATLQLMEKVLLIVNVDL